MKKIFILLIVFLLSTALFAEIKISGDARIRPRLDQKFSDGELYNSNVYYLYWARLWLDAKLTDGWYFRTKLSADGPANFVGTFGGGTFDGLPGWSTGAAHGGSRGALRFSELHFGRRTENWGLCTGILPFNALANPEYDLHFYPVSASDIPYLILNQNSAPGFRGYYKIGPGVLGGSLTVDDNLGFSDGDDKTDDVRDQYSLFLNYVMTLSGLKIQPTLIKTIGSEDCASQMTMGINSTLPKIAGITSSAGAYFTTQPEKKVGKYSGLMVHVKGVKKLGPGTVVSWIDWKTITFDGIDDPINTTFIWFMYKIMLYNSDVGSFSIAPTFRRMMQSSGAPDFARNKIEITMHITFK